MFEKQDAKRYINIYNLALLLLSGYTVKDIEIVGEKKSPVLFLSNESNKKLTTISLFAEKTSRAVVLTSIQAMSEVYGAITSFDTPRGKVESSLSQNTKEVLMDMLVAQSFITPEFESLNQAERAKYLKNIFISPETERVIAGDVYSRIQNGVYPYFTEKYIKKINEANKYDIVYQGRRMFSVPTINKAAEALAAQTDNFSEKKEIVQEWKNVSDAVEAVLLGQSLSLEQQEDEEMVKKPVA